MDFCPILLIFSILTPVKAKYWNKGVPPGIWWGRLVPPTPSYTYENLWKNVNQNPRLKSPVYPTPNAGRLQCWAHPKTGVCDAVHIRKHVPALLGTSKSECLWCRPCPKAGVCDTSRIRMRALGVPSARVKFLVPRRAKNGPVFLGKRRKLTKT